MPVTRGLPRILSHRRRPPRFAWGGGVEVEIEFQLLCFRDDDATSVMTHVDVGIVTITLVASRYRRGRVCDYTYPGVIIHDHVTSHNS